MAKLELLLTFSGIITKLIQFILNLRCKCWSE